MLCTHCGLSFELLETHYSLVHLGKKERRCLFCAELFDNNNSLFDHIIEHHDGSVYCYICKTPFINYEFLLNHIDNHPELHVYGCYKCQWTSASRMTFVNHVCQDKCENSNDSGVESIKKDSQFNTTSKLQEKKKTISTFRFSSKPRDKRNLKFIASCLGKDGYYYCTDCPKQFKTQKGLRYHLLKHKNLLSFSCDKCEKKFPNNNKLKIHRETHDTVVAFHRCHVCNNLYRNKYTLFAHQAAAHGEGFICAHCSIRFKRKHNIQLHLKSEICCGEIFRCQQMIKLHELTRDHNFTCPHCSKSFILRAELKRHISCFHRKSQTHKHNCVVCTRAYGSLYNLNRHMRRFHKIFKKKI